MVTTTDFARIVSSIYSAVLAPDGWSAALDDIRQTLGATGSALVLADASNREILSARIPEEAGDSCRRYYRHLDYVLATVERNPVGMLLSGAGLVALGAGTEFDADWMRRYDMQDGLFVRLNAQPPITSFLVAGPQGQRGVRHFPTGWRSSMPLSRTCNGRCASRTTCVSFAGPHSMPPRPWMRWAAV